MSYELYDNLYDALFNDGRRHHSLLKTDIEEKEDSYLLKVDIPGVKKEDININYNDKYLTISYKESNKEEERNKKYITKERFLGSYSRSYLFNDIDPNTIDASYVDGVLTISLAKKKEYSNRSIEIK